MTTRLFDFVPVDGDPFAGPVAPAPISTLQAYAAQLQAEAFERAQRGSEQGWWSPILADADRVQPVQPAAAPQSTNGGDNLRVPSPELAQRPDTNTPSPPMFSDQIVDSSGRPIVVFGTAQRVLDAPNIDKHDAETDLFERGLPRHPVSRTPSGLLSNALIGTYRLHSAIRNLAGNIVGGAVDAARLPGDAWRAGYEGQPLNDDEVFRRGWNAAFMLGGGGTAFARPGTLGAFGGRLAKPADLDALSRAGHDAPVEPMPFTNEEAARFQSNIPTNVDWARMSNVPDDIRATKQLNILRPEPPSSLPDNILSIGAPENIKRINELARRGGDLGGFDWYYTGPLRDAFIDILGPLEGQQSFNRYIDLVAAPSPLSRPWVNARNASYYYMLDKQGLPVP